MMFRSQPTEVRQPADIVILNFVLDTRSFLSRIRNGIYSFFSEFGQLKNAKLYDVVALSEKMTENPDYIQSLIAKIPLSKAEKADLKLHSEIICSIQEASKIYILGHCKSGRIHLGSDDGKVKTPAERIKYFFPKDMQNKNLDIIACESNMFTEALAEDLKDQASQPDGMKCNGMTLSSKTYIALPLPNGECYYLKLNKSGGLPEIFKTGQNYRKDFLIANDDVISFDISNESDAANFELLVENVRAKSNKMNSSI